MQSATEILQKGRKIFEAEIDKEARSQGHYLTGNLERSKTATITENEDDTLLEGEIVFYANIVNNGFAAEKASMKQFPFVVKFFMLRGLEEKEAKGAAAATIKKWMKAGGMPTAASSRFSETGERKNMIVRAINIAGPKYDTFIENEVSNEMNLNFGLIKNESI